jgi:hypothetical protein
MVKEAFNVTVEEEFQKLMEETDQELRAENVKTIGRPVAGWLRISSRFGLRLRMNPSKRPPRDDCYTGDDLTFRIFDWFDHRYGDRLKISLGAGEMAVFVRGDLYRLVFPRIFGTVSLSCSPEDFKAHGEATSSIGRGRPPAMNILSCIEGLTAALAQTLTPGHRTELLRLFQMGCTAHAEIRVKRDVELVEEALGDLQESVARLFDVTPRCGTSKWASLQAAEKMLKAYIKQRGQKFPYIHGLACLAGLAEAHGLPVLPRDVLVEIQCEPGVRYADSSITTPEAVRAQHLSLQLCAAVASELVASP